MIKKESKDKVISTCENTEKETFKSNLTIQNMFKKKQEVKGISLEKESFLKENRGLIIAIFSLASLYFYNEVLGKLALENALFQFQSMFLIIPPVFILLGLLDVWVDRETMIKYMGEDSKAKGIIISFLLGSCAAGPLYGAFPMVAILLKKGAKFSNILIFLGAWSTTKIPMFIFETSSLGYKFSFLRLFLDLIGIYIIAQYIEKSTSKKELKEIYTKAENLF